MSLFTVQRPCDVLRLQIRDIEFQRRIIYFSVSKTVSEFKFPIYSKLEFFLKNDLKVPIRGNKDEYLFPGMTVGGTGKTFRIIKYKLYFNRKFYYTLKSFRKYFASEMSRMGMNIQEVHALVDHKSTATAFRYDAYVRAEELKNKLDKLHETME